MFLCLVKSDDRSAGTGEFSCTTTTPRNVNHLQILLTDDGSGVAVISEWNAPEPQPTEAELSAADGLATTAEANVDVIANRMKEYSSVEEQIEFITENGLTPWQTKVSEIKAKYPKN